jgi:hypothetical protein
MTGLAALVLLALVLVVAAWSERHRGRHRATPSLHVPRRHGRELTEDDVRRMESTDADDT